LGMKGGWFARAPSNGSAKAIDLESGERRVVVVGGGPAHSRGPPGRLAWGSEGEVSERHFDNHG